MGRLSEDSHGAVYRAQSFTHTLYDLPWRFVVIHSSGLAQNE